MDVYFGGKTQPGLALHADIHERDKVHPVPCRRHNAVARDAVDCEKLVLSDKA